ncbi:hypothetical protein BGZ50_008014, partial [Haplosporangium sp. Z 11]
MSRARRYNPISVGEGCDNQGSSGENVRLGTAISATSEHSARATNHTSQYHQAAPWNKNSIGSRRIADLGVYISGWLTVGHGYDIASIFDSGTAARKCDCILGVAGLQVGNFEAKKASASKFDVAVQLRKNMKIAKRLSALVFRIMKFEGIWIVGKVCDPIILPTTTSEFQSFLKRSAHTLFRLLNEYHEYAKEVAAVKEDYDYEQRAQAQVSSATLTPLPV